MPQHVAPTVPPHVRSGPGRWGGPRAVMVALLAAAIALSACQPATSNLSISSGRGSMWISRAELMQRPTSGRAWTNLDAVAKGNWGSPSLSDNNATHDTSTLAGAIVGVRTNDPAMVAKTRAAIMAVTRTTSYARVLELSRNITSYVVAADIVGLPTSDDARFRSFISGLRTKPLSGHSGGTDLLSTALRSPNNWGTMARAAMVSIDLYLNDRPQLAEVAKAHRAWLGEQVPNQLKYSDTRWHTAAAKAGIDRRGATIAGRSVDGVIAEDQRRTGEPSSSAAPRGSYPWEALQGAMVTSVLLDRAGIVDIHAGDDALVRAFTWLYQTNQNPAVSDDEWQPWLLNAVAGTRFTTTEARSPGKNMAWTDWTHGQGAA